MSGLGSRRGRDEGENRREKREKMKGKKWKGEGEKFNNTRRKILLA